MTKLNLSSLPHTWIIDIDGTIVKHNGHKHGGDVLLAGVREFWNKIPIYDEIILLSAREPIYEEITVNFLKKSGIRFNRIIFGLPKGERILINDTKPSGLITAYSINVDRDLGLTDVFFNDGESELLF